MASVRHKLLSTSLVGILALGAWVFYRTTAQGLKDLPNRSAASSWAFQCHKDAAQRYAVQYRSNAKLGQAPMAKSFLPWLGEEGQLRLALHGSLEELCLKEDEKSQTLALHIHAESLSLQGSSFQGAAEAEQQLRSGLPLGVFLKRTRTGQVTEIIYAPGTGTMVQALWRDLLAQRSFILPAQDVKDHWETAETDIQGPFNASYSVMEDNGQEWTIRKVRSYRPDAERPMIYNGEQSVVWMKKEGRWQSTQVAQSWTHSSQGLELQKTETQYEEKYVSAQPADKARQSTLRTQLAAWSRVPDQQGDLSGSEVDRRLRVQMQTREIAGTTWEGVVAGVEEVTSETDPTATKLWLQLRAWLILHPDKADELLKRMTEWSAEAYGFKVAMLALVDANEPVVQESLQRFMAADAEHSEDPAVSSRLQIMLSHTTFIKEPSLDMVNTVKRIAEDGVQEDLRLSAWLSLGGLVDSMRATENRGHVQQLVKVLSSRWSEAQSVHEKENVLFALGNARAVETKVLIETQLKHQEARVRAAAIRALASLKVSDQNSLILGMLQDPDDEVRKEAAVSLSEVSLSSSQLGILITSINQEKNHVVRGVLLRTNANVLRENQAGRELLERLSRLDRSVEVRDLAASILKG